MGGQKTLDTFPCPLVMWVMVEPLGEDWKMGLHSTYREGCTAPTERTAQHLPRGLHNTYQEGCTIHTKRAAQNLPWVLHFIYLKGSTALPNAAAQQPSEMSHLYQGSCTAKVLRGTYHEGFRAFTKRAHITYQERCAAPTKRAAQHLPKICTAPTKRAAQHRKKVPPWTPLRRLVFKKNTHTRRPAFSRVKFWKASS